MKSVKKAKKPKKKRAKTYEKPLKIEGTFKQAIKALVRDIGEGAKKEE
jgi:hypothetical protein